MERAALHSQAGCIFPGSFTASLLTILGMRSECKAESLSLSSVCCLCQALVTSGASSLFQFFLHLGLFGCFFPHEQRVYRRKKKKRNKAKTLFQPKSMAKVTIAVPQNLLLNVSRKRCRGAAHCAFRGPHRPKFSKEYTFIQRRGQDCSPASRH